MKQSFRANISANTIQLLTNQVFNLLVFYFLSKGLDKSTFGELNWTLAIFLTVYSILSFGIDQLIIRKIALQQEKAHLLSLHFFHVLVFGCLFIAILLTGFFLSPNFFQQHPLILLLGFGKLLLFFATPFKAVASGSENFKALLLISISSAIIKALCIGYLFFTNTIQINTIVFVFIIADLSELVLGFWVSVKKMKTAVQIGFYWKEYKALIKESLPQLGTVLLSSALGRIDWILIGLFLSASKLAEYSFAYKAFEVSSLPLLVIAPLLLPYFSRTVKEGKELNQQAALQLLLRIEIMVACLTAICLNVLWNPVVDVLTDGKYGSTNTTTVLLLSLALPVYYFNNFLWTALFAHGRVKKILQSFALCFAINLVGNLVLIPLIGNEGAALSYLLALSLQTIYYWVAFKEKSYINWMPIFICFICACSTALLMRYTTLSTTWLLALCIGTFLLVCTVQLRKTDWNILRQIILR